jgi:predicted TIM-barrel fold metal-dependent hydrolase
VIVIDAQVHAYEHNHPGRPWAGTLPGPAAVTGDDMIAAMDAVGVHRALLVSPWTMYRTDTSYAVEVHRDHPDRFRLVAPIDPYEQGADAVIAWAGVAGAAGIRLMAAITEGFRPDDRPVTATIEAAQTAGFPVSVFCPNQLWILDELARLHPDTQFILDHLGLTQPLAPPRPIDPFADLDNVLALAQNQNVAVKLTGVCTLSHRRFPFEDLWPPLYRVFDAFGIQRCMWGSDWTRTVDFLTYSDSVAAFHEQLPLSGNERAALMGGVVKRIFAWT